MRGMGDGRVERLGGCGGRSIVGAQLQDVAPEAFPLDSSSTESDLSNMCVTQTLPFKRP